MTQTVRDASDANGLVSEMRQMVQAGLPVPVIDDPGVPRPGLAVDRRTPEILW